MIESVSTASVQRRWNGKSIERAPGLCVVYRLFLLPVLPDRWTMQFFITVASSEQRVFSIPFPRKKLIFAAYHYTLTITRVHLYNSDPLTVLREIRQFKGIDINFNGSVFYARRDSRVISTRAVCMCVCMYGFRKNRVLNLRRKP